jgi:hypothetical protein
MLIHPNNGLLGLWNIYISILLIFSCMTTPLHLAYFDSSSFFADPDDKISSKVWNIVNNVIDMFFLSDILVTFNTMVYNSDFMLI